MATSGDDVTYQPDNFHEQGGRWVIGAQCDVVSGGSIQIESGGSFSLADGASFAMPVTARAVATVATAIPEYGITTITASTTDPKYTLSGPSMAGLMKIIAVTANTSSGTCKVNAETTAVTFSSSATVNQLTFDNVVDRVMLVSLTTAMWAIVGNTGSVGVAARTT